MVDTEAHGLTIVMAVAGAGKWFAGASIALPSGSDSTMGGIT
jgi:hypothetical protein